VARIRDGRVAPPPSCDADGNSFHRRTEQAALEPARFASPCRAARTLGSRFGSMFVRARPSPPTVLGSRPYKMAEAYAITVVCRSTSNYGREKKKKQTKKRSFLCYGALHGGSRGLLPHRHMLTLLRREHTCSCQRMPGASNKSQPGKAYVTVGMGGDQISTMRCGSAFRTKRERRKASAEPGTMRRPEATQAFVYARRICCCSLGLRPLPCSTPPPPPRHVRSPTSSSYLGRIPSRPRWPARFPALPPTHPRPNSNRPPPHNRRPSES
jgi:hypothetical protein